MYELVYTSSPRGLLAGRSGFSTVAITAGFPPNLISPVENMSGYRNLFPPGHPDAEHNPVNYSCQHYRWGGTLFIVLSRISYAGLSFTGRTNVLAHHLLFTPAELAAIPGGATAVLRCPENFPPWTGDPRELPQKNLKRIGRAPAASPELWAELAGDRNWAAYAAECFRTDPQHGLAVAFDPVRFSGETLLDLIDSAANCLSPEEAMDFTFCTYCTSPSITSSLALRGFPEGSPQLANVEHLMPQSVIRLGRDNPIPGGWQPPVPPGPAEPPGPPAEPLPPADREILLTPEAPEPSAPARIRPIHPRPPRIRALVPGGRAPGSPLPQTDSTQPEEVPERRLPLRGIIFAATTLLLGGLLLALVFTSSPGGGGGGTKTSPAAPASPETPSRSAPAPRTAQPSTPPRRAPQKPARPAGAQTAPRAETPDEILEQRFRFHKEFNLARKAVLPKPFRKNSSLAVTLGGIGDEKGLPGLESYVSAGGAKVTVHPFTLIPSEPEPLKGKDGESPHVMTLELKGGFLIVKVPGRAGNRPRIENIDRITITGPRGERFDFTPNDPDRKFITLIRRNPGKATVKRPEPEKALYECRYTFSDDLLAFRRHLGVRYRGKSVGDIESKTIFLAALDFTDAQRLLDRWNTAVEDYWNAKNDLDLCGKEDNSFGKDFEVLMSKFPKTATARKKKLVEAVEKGKRSISAEVAVLCAGLPLYKKDESAPPEEHPLARSLKRLEKRWNDLQERKKKEIILRQKAAVRDKLRAETEGYLETLPPQLFRSCLEKVKKNEGVSPGFCTKISVERLEKAIKIEPYWREDHGSTSNDR